MVGQRFKVGLVGASTLLGKELSEELAESALADAELVLLDEDASDGQVTEAGGEVALIRRLSKTSFEGMDFVFFAGSRELTRLHWQTARQAGAFVIDSTEALAGLTGVLVWSPWVKGRVAAGETRVARPDLETAAIVVADPAAVMLAMVAERLQQAGLPVRLFAATVLQPASEHGRAGLEELHQQTVNLLSFQELPTEHYDAQVAFNLLTEIGGEAKATLRGTQELIAAQASAITGSETPVSVQVVHAPVFHGYGVSLLVEFAKAESRSAVAAALQAPKMDVLHGDGESPSNLAAAGQSKILLRLESPGEDTVQRVWIWMVADNLKLSATQAIDSALAMRSLRPRGKVQ